MRALAGGLAALLLVVTSALAELVWRLDPTGVALAGTGLDAAGAVALVALLLARLLTLVAVPPLLVIAVWPSPRSAEVLARQPGARPGT
jgi:hypothetical protein